MHVFENIEKAPPDAILGLSADYLADQRKNKVNLGAGVYKSADLKPFILHSVKQAEASLLETETSKDYLPIDGLVDYVQRTKELVFGKTENPARIYGAQTVGGTGALRIGGSFLKDLGFHTLSLSIPTWPNHKRIFQHAGLKVSIHPYFDKKTKGFDFEGFREGLAALEPRSIVLLQACCHNPTGIDPTPEQWEEICTLMQERDLFPFFDLAYQGFGSGLEKDTAALSLFLSKGMEFAVAVSHAKNFGLYAERCGALYFVCREAQEAQNVGSQIKILIRGFYSSPPCHGARIVAAILQDSELKKHWLQELNAMRERIQEMRIALVAGLQAKTSTPDFAFLRRQNGMFSYTGLSEPQVERLIVEYGIYMPKDGRINVAGLNAENLDYVIDSLLAVSK